MAYQVGDPGSVPFVRLASRHILDAPGPCRRSGRSTLSARRRSGPCARATAARARDDRTFLKALRGLASATHALDPINSPNRRGSYATPSAGSAGTHIRPEITRSGGAGAPHG